MFKMTLMPAFLRSGFTIADFNVFGYCPVCNEMLTILVNKGIRPSRCCLRRCIQMGSSSQLLVADLFTNFLTSISVKMAKFLDCLFV